MNEIYHHTQVGRVMLVALACAFVGLLFAGTQEGWPAGLIGVLITLTACLILFTTLTVRIGSGVIQVLFGPGLPRRTIRLADIESARAATNSWLTGYGIRWIGSGWLYNVSGRDAVELKLRNGRVVRIGTDEPEALLGALRRAEARILVAGGSRPA